MGGVTMWIKFGRKGHLLAVRMRSQIRRAEIFRSVQGEMIESASPLGRCQYYFLRVPILFFLGDLKIITPQISLTQSRRRGDLNLAWYQI